MGKAKLNAPIQCGVHFTHKKSGGIYKVLATGFIEADLTPATIYQEWPVGIVWVRPFSEFNDGRFLCLDGPLSQDEQQAQGKRCGCRGCDDMCVCQNSPDKTTLVERATPKGGA